MPADFGFTVTVWGDLMTKWNGKISSMSISQEGCPELFNELSCTSHRERAARLRTLALIGLFALRQQGVVAQNIGPIGEAQNDAKAPVSTKAADEFRSKIHRRFSRSLGSVGEQE